MARRDLPLGQQVHAMLKGSGHEAAQQHALGLGQPDLFDRVQAVAFEEPVPSFLAFRTLRHVPASSTAV